MYSALISLTAGDRADLVAEDNGTQKKQDQTKDGSEGEGGAFSIVNMTCKT